MKIISSECDAYTKSSVSTVESHLVSKHYGVYVMYNDDDHDLIYDGERS